MRLKELTEPHAGMLYHFSTEENLDKIRKSHFIPSEDDALYGPGIYLTDNDNFRTTLPYLKIQLAKHKTFVATAPATHALAKVARVPLDDPHYTGNMLDLGYKSVSVKRPDGSTWVIILDPRIIKILD